MNFAESVMSEEVIEPQITSTDRDERKLARRLRIQRRLSAANERLAAEAAAAAAEDEDGFEKLPAREKTQLESQVENSNNEVYDIIDEGIESVTNIRVAGNSFEVQRREEDRLAKEERIKYLEAEAKIAEDKFMVINERWAEIAKHNDPLHLYEETESQKDKCRELLEKKDVVIKRLQEELKSAELRFLKDQEKQSADINLLVFRINEQIKIMRRVVKTQISLIEEGIESERAEVIETFSKKWEQLNRQRERDQVNNLEQKMNSLEEHNEEMEKIMITHQEKYRETKISLEMDIQTLQREVEAVKAICLLNKENIDYNYQVLKKRDDENLLIKSQQKRRINKLQDIATNLRHKIHEMAKQSEAEIMRLKSEVVTLYNNINDREKKAQHFASVNDVKFSQVWKFNKDTANQLLRKILAMDQIIHEQLLGLEWNIPEEIYSKYVLHDDESEKFPQEVVDENNKSSIVVQGGVEEGEGCGKEALINHILKIVANSSGFLVEEQLNKLLEPYTVPQRTLVYLHNIFSALGVKEAKDIELLTEVLDPYIECLTCLQSAAADAESGIYRKQAEAAFVEEAEKGDKLETDGILAQISDMVTQQVNIVHNVVSEVSALRKDSPTYLLKKADEEDDMSDESKDSMTQEKKETIENLECLVSTMAAKDSETDRSKLLPGISQLSIATKISITKNDISEEEKDENEETDSKKEVQLLTCKNPSHTLTIESINVLKALKEFVSLLHNKQNKELPLTLNEKLLKMQTPNSGTLSKKDISTFWDGYKNAFTVKNEELWDALLLGLKKYHSILQDRHYLNAEVKKLKIQNEDLKRLLTSYTIPATVKRSRLLFNHSDERNDSIVLPMLEDTNP